MKHRSFLVLVAALLSTGNLCAQTTGNLLRNASLQDDWLTLIPENKNHHWCYSSEFYHRRDFNPDGWICKGSWDWLNAHLPAGDRQFYLKGPNAEIAQRVNWVLFHDSTQLGNMADAGRFPSIVPVRSKTPEKFVRDLVFRVRLTGHDVQEKAGVIEISYCPPGSLTLADPLGTQMPPTVTAIAPITPGTSVTHVVEVKLSATEWIKKAQEQAAKDPKEAALVAKDGLVLPGTVRVAIRYQGKTGQVLVKHAELVETSPIAPNLLANGGFETVVARNQDKLAKPQAAAWGPPTKYRHFPGRLYYLFNTWHNGAFDNRGKVQLDSLLPHSGRYSLQMIVPPGDEVSVASDPIALKQKEPRLIEVRAWVRTDKLCMLNLDAVTDKGERLDGYPFIHMAPHSIGTDEWRPIRQVFKPRTPVQSLQLQLCARGVNGYTLDDTGTQPQNNVVGTIWWDDVHVSEPESTPAELASRGVKTFEPQNPAPGPRLVSLDLGETMLGPNVLRATMMNAGPAEKYTLFWEFTPPGGKIVQVRSAPKEAPANNVTSFEVPYELNSRFTDAYTHIRGRVALENSQGTEVADSEIWFGTWTTPIDIDLGALYLRPEQKQFVRLNFGLSQPLLKKLATVRLEIVRQGTGKVLATVDHPVKADGSNFATQRAKLPKGLRDDLTTVLLYDLDVSTLPVQPFADPQRNCHLRVSALDAQGKLIAADLSPPFCRLAPQPAQPPVQSVSIKKDMLYVNGQPWLPFGVVYGHVPVYTGPANPGQYLDLHNLPGWSMYDGFTAAGYTRKQNDFNCMRYVAGSVTDPKIPEKNWTGDNLYASSVYAIPQPAFALDDMFKQAGGKAKLDAYLAFCKTAPMVVSIAPGIEEAFGLFHHSTPAQLKGLEQVADVMRKATGKPIMVGHGGYWNRLEFEKVPFFDIFDPETEPWYPAQLHTDLAPIVAGKDKVVWLRPQMYEDVPFERWRYHVYVEMMRGARGWQIAHGPGDASLFRGLHGEIEFWKPILASQDAGPKVTAPDGVEHWSRKHQGKTYLIAATTRGIGLGKWHWDQDGPLGTTKRYRVTGDAHLNLNETNSYGADQAVDKGPSIHGIHYLPGAKAWPQGTKLVQTVRLDEKAMPNNLVVLVKNEGRWTQAASWGKFDVAKWNADPKQAFWFLRSFYRHANGFLGWGEDLLDKARPYLLSKIANQGALPAAGDWVQLEVPLETLGATGMLDGVAFAHEGGRVIWQQTMLITPDQKVHIVWDEEPLRHRPRIIEESLPIGPEKIKIAVAGLKKGTRIRVLFEDRELVADEGFFIDDFRGRDLYQRFGGGPGVGYGDGPVALHLYEIP